MANNDLLLCKLNLNINGNTASMNLHYKITLGGNAEDPCGALAAGFAGALDSLLEAMAENVQLASIDTRVVQGENRPPSLGLLAAFQGEGGLEALPLTKAVVIQLQQDQLPGRFNGRLYVPGVAESDTTGNLLSNAGVTSSLNQWMQDVRLITFDSGTDVYEFLQCIKSAGEGGIVNPRVQTQTISPIIYSQRKRRTEARGVFANA